MKARVNLDTRFSYSEILIKFEILKYLQHLLQDFQSMSDNLGTLCIKGLKEQKPWVQSAGSGDVWS